jgi:uncharacterized membrane protein
MSTPNPYAAPKAPVADPGSAAPGHFLPTGRTVPAGHGWSWIAEGWELFKRQPGVWIALIVIAALIFIGLSLIPVLGPLATVVLSPVFAGGIMIGCQKVQQGGELEISHLFAGFREHSGRLVTVGFIYLGLTVAIALVVGLVTGAGMWTLLGGGADPVALGAAGLTILLAMLVMLALMLPVFMAIWFAAPLVVFHEQAAGEAMRNSFFASLKNIGPFIVYSAVLFVAAIVASIPLGLGWLVLGPVIAGSLYTSYRDLFFE